MKGLNDFGLALSDDGNIGLTDYNRWSQVTQIMPEIRLPSISNLIKSQLAHLNQATRFLEKHLADRYRHE
jgi:hypothetical protein